MFDKFKQVELIGQDVTFEDYTEMLDAEGAEQRLMGEALDINKPQEDV